MLRERHEKAQIFWTKKSRVLLLNFNSNNIFYFRAIWYSDSGAQCQNNDTSTLYEARRRAARIYAVNRLAPRHAHTHAHVLLPSSLSFLGPCLGNFAAYDSRDRLHSVFSVNDWARGPIPRKDSEEERERERDDAEVKKKEGGNGGRRRTQHHFEHGASRSLASLGTETGIGIPEDSSARSRFLDRYRFFLFYTTFLPIGSLLFRRKSNFCDRGLLREDFSIPYHCIRPIPKYDSDRRRMTRSEKDILSW